MTTEAQQLLIELHTRGNSKRKEIIMQAFPELFKPFKNGEWFKHYNGALVRITDFEKGEAYGFNSRGEWIGNGKFYSFNTNPEVWQKATEEEVIEAFKKEFEKRGFKEDVKFKSLYCGDINKFKGLDFEHFFNEKVIEIDGQIIYSQCYVIYKNGVFAEIVEEPKTIEQRLKTAFIDVFDKASCIQHWHCANNGGMVVSSKHVKELWEVLEKYKSFRDFIS